MAAPIHQARVTCEATALIGAGCDLAHWLHFAARVAIVFDGAAHIGAFIGCVAVYLAHIEDREHRRMIADHIDRATADGFTVPEHYRKAL